MTPRIQSLHHVTATVNDAQEDLDFYARLLGQRLVKKTVNFDNHHVYHFYYGNEHGTPGTIMTTFPYKGMGVREGIHGAGQVTVTSFSVPASSLTFWHARLEHAGVKVEQRHAFNEEALAFRDPSGLVIQLVGNTNDGRDPWVDPAREDIRPKYASRGLHGVTLLVREPARTVDFLVHRLGATFAAEDGNSTRLSVGTAGPGHYVDVALAHYAAPNAVNGLGTVHHVAFAIGTEEEQLTIREDLLEHGAHVTEVRDREYFRSIYFREPGGVLYEIATLPPGFTVDEDLAALGTSLKLPPWEEPNRADIEAHLPAVTHP